MGKAKNGIPVKRESYFRVVSEEPEPNFTAKLMALPTSRLRARSNGSFREAALQAAHYAKKHNQLTWLYKGNSYGVAVWRSTFKQSDPLSLSNMGSKIYSIAPDFEVRVYTVERTGSSECLESVNEEKTERGCDDKS